MATRTLHFELPEELVDLLGSPQAVTDRAREALVLELLREERISQGQASRLLDLTRWEIIALMTKYRIPSGPATVSDLHRELEDMRHIAPES